MRTLPDNAEEVQVRNSENNSYASFTLRKDRLLSFYQFLITNRASGYPQSIMPGISGAAHFGLDCIFFGPRPPRFPAHDILNFLRNEQKTYLGDYPNPTVTTQEIEYVLGKWAETVSQLLADGSDRA